MGRTMTERDHGLDYIKGIACLLMILAHGMVAERAGWVLWVKYIGQYAPILFFAGSGASMTYQSKRRRTLSIVIFYIFFFVLGFSYNGLHVSDYWHVFDSDILQCIALSSIVLALLLRWLPAQALALIAPVPFALHVLLQRLGVFADFAVAQMLIPPGIFPLLPWLSFFLLGAAAYRMRDWIKAEVFIGLAVLLAVLGMAGVSMDFFNKWNMSFGYFMLSCAGVVITFLLARWARDWRMSALGELGKYSLLFLYVHYIPIYLLDYFRIDSPLIVWPAVLIAAPSLMIAFHWLNARLFAKIAGHWWFWAVLLGMVIADPFLFRYKITIYILSYVIGILFALNYRELMRLTGRAADRLFPAKVRKETV